MWIAPDVKNNLWGKHVRASLQVKIERVTGNKPVMRKFGGSEEVGRKSTKDEERLPENVNQRHPSRKTD
jgi:hypothetical protein